MIPKCFGSRLPQTAAFFTEKIPFYSQAPFTNLDQELPETKHFSTTDQDQVTRFPKFIEIK